MVNGWKVTAIIFILLFIAETSFLIYALNLGIETEKNEYECAYNICGDYQSYNYDDYSDMCYCFENNEIVVERYIK
jgi:hypothetical protein